MNKNHGKTNLDELRRLSGIVDVEFEFTAEDLQAVDGKYIKADFGELLQMHIDELTQEGKSCDNKYPQVFRRCFLFDEIDPNDMTDEEIMDGWDWRSDLLIPKR